MPVHSALACLLQALLFSFDKQIFLLAGASSYPIKLCTFVAKYKKMSQ